MNAKIIGGGKQTLVLAHGYGTSQALWDDVVPALSRRYRVLLFDWSFSGAAIRNDGANTAFDASKYPSYGAFSDDLIGLLDGMNVGDAVFVGHSMAGMIGCIASVERPDLFSRLVLVGASPRYLNSKDYIGGFEKTDIDNLLSSIESNFLAWAQDFPRLVIGANDPISVKKLANEFTKMRPETALSVARTVFLSDTRDVLGSVSIPCTVIQGTNDVVVPVSVGRYIVSRVKGEAKLELIEMDGHFPQLTVPKQFIDVLDKVLMPK